jgi:dUTP pyrophosphatase
MWRRPHFTSGSIFTSPAKIDYRNTERRAASTTEFPFQDDGIHLKKGVYLVDFEESVDMPRDCAGELKTRSTLWRSGVTIEAGVIDAGYKGALGAQLNVRNPFGVRLRKGAKLAQMVVLAMEEEVDGYQGIYQNSTNSAGLDGAGKIDRHPEGGVVKLGGLLQKRRFHSNPPKALLAQ